MKILDVCWRYRIDIKISYIFHILKIIMIFTNPDSSSIRKWLFPYLQSVIDRQYFAFLFGTCIKKYSLSLCQIQLKIHCCDKILTAFIYFSFYKEAFMILLGASVFCCMLCHTFRTDFHNLAGFFFIYVVVFNCI